MHRPTRCVPLSKPAIETVKTSYEQICGRFLETSKDNRFYDYVRSSVANEATLDRHIRAFQIYAPYLSDDMRVLDWGCRHAPDSCMMRTLYPNIDLHGCDFADDDFSVFHDYARLNFKTIRHEFALPYDDQSFDAVLSSGVLEHVGFEHESIREVWRVLKDDGLLFVTFLPNRSSLTENMSRLMGSYGGHNRLYDLEKTKDVFLRSGFVVEQYGFHQVFPSFGKNIKAGKTLDKIAWIGSKLNRVAEKIPVMNAMAANIFFVLRRVRHM